VSHYSRGAEQAAQIRARWMALAGRVDQERFVAVAAKLDIQAGEARAWRDKCLRYFRQFSQRPLPAGIGGGSGR
jgi:alpha-glucuronidase